MQVTGRTFEMSKSEGLTEDMIFMTTRPAGPFTGPLSISPRPAVLSGSLSGLCLLPGPLVIPTQSFGLV